MNFFVYLCVIMPKFWAFVSKIRMNWEQKWSVKLIFQLRTSWRNRIWVSLVCIFPKVLHSSEISKMLLLTKENSSKFAINFRVVILSSINLFWFNMKNRLNRYIYMIIAIVFQHFYWFFKGSNFFWKIEEFFFVEISEDCIISKWHF